ncbi:hypothetical protein NE237_004106 [Protea cynaroides]|uniref:C3H1-type domain-containing protein n=1 Tax=Protea cynaroides TaxID=273540 RepID=A0A9Q0QTA1_9MAGN|nr:hypothetical protein NE237_004106 [Protea cynaroides]
MPYNTRGDDDYDEDDDPYSSDDFLMYEFKVRRCMHSRSNDWTDCPFANPGEKARRKDPQRYHYSGNVCTDFWRGGCHHGDACEFVHGVLSAGFTRRGIACKLVRMGRTVSRRFASSLILLASSMCCFCIMNKFRIRFLLLLHPLFLLFPLLLDSEVSRSQ